MSSPRRDRQLAGSMTTEQLEQAVGKLKALQAQFEVLEKGVEAARVAQRLIGFKSELEARASLDAPGSLSGGDTDHTAENVSWSPADLSASIPGSPQVARQQQRPTLDSSDNLSASVDEVLVPLDGATEEAVVDSATPVAEGRPQSYLSLRKTALQDYNVTTVHQAGNAMTKHGWRARRFDPATQLGSRCLYCGQALVSVGLSVGYYYCDGCQAGVHEDCCLLVPLASCTNIARTIPDGGASGSSVLSPGAESLDEPIEASRPLRKKPLAPAKEEQFPEGGVERLMLLQRTASMGKTALSAAIRDHAAHRANTHGPHRDSGALSELDSSCSDDSDVELIASTLASSETFVAIATELATRNEKAKTNLGRSSDLIQFSSSSEDEVAEIADADALESGLFGSDDVMRQCIIPDAGDPSLGGSASKRGTIKRGTATVRIKSAMRLEGPDLGQFSAHKRGRRRSVVPWMPANFSEDGSWTSDSPPSSELRSSADSSCTDAADLGSASDIRRSMSELSSPATPPVTNQTDDLGVRPGGRRGTIDGPAPGMDNSPLHRRLLASAVEGNRPRASSSHEPAPGMDNSPLHRRLLASAVEGNRPRASSSHEPSKQLRPSPKQRRRETGASASPPTLVAKKRENMWLAQERKRANSKGPRASKKKPDETAVLDIKLHLDKNEYMPGEKVSGTVFLDCIQHLHHTSRVRVLIQGFERAFAGVAVSQLSKAIASVGGADERNAKYRYESRMFFHDVVTVWEPSKNEKNLKRGQYAWKFKVKLPINIPSTTYFEDWCSNFYQARAFCEPTEDAFGVVATSAYTHALEGEQDIDVEKIPVARSPTAVRKQRHPLSDLITSQKEFFDIYSVNAKLWRKLILAYSRSPEPQINPSNLCEMKIQIPRSDYSIGENIDIQIKLETGSMQTPLELRAIRIRLVQSVRVHLERFQCEFDDVFVDEITHTCTKNTVLGSDQTFFQELSIRIPDNSDLLIPTASGLLWSAKHALQVKVKIQHAGSSVLQTIVPSKGGGRLDGEVTTLRIWDALWDAPLGSPISEGEEAVPATTDWKFKTLQIWTRSLSELPVSKDLPRLADKINFVVQSPDTESTGSFSRGVKLSQIIAKYDHLLNSSETGIRRLLNRVLGIIVTLCAILESNAKADRVIGEYWMLVGRYMRSAMDMPDEETKVSVRSTQNAGASTEQLSRILDELFEKSLGENSPVVRVLKACHQAIVAPAVIELSKAMMATLPFKDGGDWNIQIGLDSNGPSSPPVTIVHSKRQASLQSTDSVCDFFFEWELQMQLAEFSSSTGIVPCGDLRDFSFGLRKVQVSPSLPRTRRDSIGTQLSSFFSQGSMFESSTGSKMDNDPEAHATMKISREAQRKHGSFWFDPEESNGDVTGLGQRAQLLLLPGINGDPFDCRTPTVLNSIAFALRELIVAGTRVDSQELWREYRDMQIQQLKLRKPSDQFLASLRLTAAAWFGLTTSTSVRNMDIEKLPGQEEISPAQIQTLNLNRYVDEHSLLMELVATELKSPVPLFDQTLHKLKMPFSRLLLPATLPLMGDQITIETVDGMLRRSSADAELVNALTDKTSDAQKLEETSEVNSFGANLKATLESCAMFLQDKQSLEAIISHFNSSEAKSPAFLARFFNERMVDDKGKEFPTARVLRCCSLSLLSLGFSRISEHFERSRKSKFLISDVARSWRVKIEFGRGDGSLGDAVVITNTKCAKSTSQDALAPSIGHQRGGFEIIWQLRLVWSFDMESLRAVQLRIATVQPSSDAYSVSKFRELVLLCQNFNTQASALAIPLPPAGYSPWAGPDSEHVQEVIARIKATIDTRLRFGETSLDFTKRDFSSRKRLRQRLRKLQSQKLADQSAPIVAHDCAIIVEVAEGEYIGQPTVAPALQRGLETTGRSRSSSGSLGKSKRILRRSLSMVARTKAMSKPPSPYVIVEVISDLAVPGDQCGVTSVSSRTHHPVWQETFELVVANGQRDNLRVFLFDSARTLDLVGTDTERRRSDLPIGWITIPIAQFSDQEVHDRWYTLQATEQYNDAVLNGTAPPMDPGKLRLQIHFREDLILPLALYSDLHELVAKESHKTVIFLEIVHQAFVAEAPSTSDESTVRQTGNLESILFASAINICTDRGPGFTVDVVSSLCSRYLQSVSLEDAVSRCVFSLDGQSTSAAARALSAYLWLIGKGFVTSLVGPIIKQIVNHDTCTDLDPVLVESPKNVEKNEKKLRNLVKHLVDELLEARHAVPDAIRNILRSIEIHAASRWKVLIAHERSEGRATLSSLDFGFDLSTVALGNAFVGLLLAPALADSVQRGVFGGKVIPRRARDTLFRASRLLRRMSIGLPYGTANNRSETNEHTTHSDSGPMRERSNSLELVALNACLEENSPRLLNLFKFLALPRTETDAFAGLEQRATSSHSASHQRVILEKELATVHRCCHRIRRSVVQHVSEGDSEETSVAAEVVRVTQELTEICAYESAANP